MLKTNNNNRWRILKSPALWIGIVAAFLYSSWPLGYLLNPAVAHHAFASQLEASGQPYNWLFISLDVVSGFALLMVGITQWIRTKHLAIRLSILSYSLFAILIMVAALVPFNCDSMPTKCTDVIHSPLFVIHGLTSIVSIVALFSCIFLIILSLFTRKRLRNMWLFAATILTAWGVNGIVAIEDYHRVVEIIVQYIFITICSVSIIFAVVFIEYLSKEIVPLSNDSTNVSQ